jgi:hypothetical protein
LQYQAKQHSHRRAVGETDRDVGWINHCYRTNGMIARLKSEPMGNFTNLSLISVIVAFNVMAGAFALKGWSDRRVALFIFLALWLTYGFIKPDYRSVYNPNSVSRMALIFSILENQTLKIDKFALTPSLQDKAVFDGSSYSDKAPGLSLTALPFVAALTSGARVVGVELRSITDYPSRFYLLTVFVACLCTSAVATAAAAAVIFLLSRHWQLSRDAAVFSAVVYGLATPTAGWATMFFSHAMAGSLLIAAFAIAILATETEKYARWDIGIGFLEGALLSWSFSVEFTGAPAALILSMFGICRLFGLPRSRRIRLLAGAIGGGAMAAVPLAVYNHLAFDSIWHFAYENVTAYPGMKEGFLGESMPSPAVLFELIFGQRRGILWFSPVLVFAPFAYVYAFRHLRIDVALILLLVPATYLLINSGYYYWDGGDSTGPRHITASLGFISLAFGPLWNFSSLRMRSALVAAGLISVVISLVCASVDMAAPSDVEHPLLKYIFPRFVHGDVHNVLVFAARLSGPFSLLGIPLLWALAAIIVVLGVRRRPSDGDLDQQDSTNIIAN